MRLPYLLVLFIIFCVPFLYLDLTELFVNFSCSSFVRRYKLVVLSRNTIFFYLKFFKTQTQPYDIQFCNSHIILIMNTITMIIIMIIIMIITTIIIIIVVIIIMIKKVIEKIHQSLSGHKGIQLKKCASVQNFIST